jgi:hypothetical protein
MQVGFPLIRRRPAASVCRRLADAGDRNCKFIGKIRNNYVIKIISNSHQDWEITLLMCVYLQMQAIDVDAPTYHLVILSICDASFIAFDSPASRRLVVCRRLADASDRCRRPCLPP